MRITSCWGLLVHITGSDDNHPFFKVTWERRTEEVTFFKLILWVAKNFWNYLLDPTQAIENKNYLATCRKFHLKISTERNYHAQMWTKTNTHTFVWFSRKNLAQVFFFPFSFHSHTHHIYSCSLWCTHTHTLSLTHLLTQKVNSANNAKFKFSFLFNTNLENELEPMTAEQANVIIYIYS